MALWRIKSDCLTQNDTCIRIFQNFSSAVVFVWPRLHSGKASGSRSKGRVFDTGTGHI